MRLHRLVILLALLSSIYGCSQPAGSDAANNSPTSVDKNEPPLVLVTSYPLFAIATEIAGEDADVRYPIPETQTSRTWRPTAADISLFQQADAVIVHGAGYERWLSKVTLPKSRITNSLAAASESLIVVNQAMSHQHGPTGSNAEKDLVWCTWMDPQLIRKQVESVEQSLLKVCPQPNSMTQRAASLLKRIESVEQSVQDIAKRTRGLKVVTDGPHFDYLLRRLGWQQIPVYLHSEDNADALQTIATLTADERPKFHLSRNAENGDLSRELSKQNVIHVNIDICEEPGPQPFLDRLEQSFEKLQTLISE